MYSETLLRFYGEKNQQLKFIEGNTLPCNSILKFALKLGHLSMLLLWEILVSWKNIKMHTK